MTVVISAAAVRDASGDTGPGWLLVDHGLVRDRGSGTAPEFGGAERAVVEVVAPGLFDSHVHGARGVDFGTPGADPAPAIELHRSSGATTLLASLATCTPDALLTRIAELRPLVEAGTLAGLHLEGPWLAPARRGAHAADLLRAPDSDEIERVLETAAGTVRMVTLAPELPGAFAAIEQFARTGVIVALGHSAADAETAERAMDAGASVVTHLFNGMPPLLSREPGIVGVALSRSDITVELIADGVHVSDTVVEVVFAAASGRVSLVSDAMSATALGDGRYDLAGSDVTVADGVARLSDGSSLAGSTTPLAVVVERLLARGLDAGDVLAAASLTPARALAVDLPALRIGDRADLVTVTDGTLRAMGGGAWLASSR